MTSGAWQEELRFARHLADLADPVALNGFRSGARIRTKPDGSLVTESDEAVEHLMRAEIAAAYPDDGILGEEQGTTDGGGRRWIIDPIDGTSNYAWGIPVWATLIALEVDGDVVVGVASAPALGERYSAARGAGAERNGEPIRVSGIEELADARVAYSYTAFQGFCDAERFARFLGSVGSNRGFSDFWGHMLVAAGSLDVMVEPVAAPWDLASLLVIVEEAGGRATDLAGERRIDGGSFLSTNGRLHTAALEAVRGALTSHDLHR